MSTNFKKVSKAGGIILPVEVRRDYGFSAGQAVEVSIAADGNSVILTKYTPRCMFCGSSEDVIHFKDRHICKACIAEMGEC